MSPFHVLILFIYGTIINTKKNESCKKCFLCFNVQYKLNFNLVNSIVLVAEQLIYYREKAHTPTILALHKCSILSSLRKCVCKTKCNEVLTEALFQRNYGTVFVPKRSRRKFKCRLRFCMLLKQNYVPFNSECNS